MTVCLGACRVCGNVDMDRDSNYPRVEAHHALGAGCRKCGGGVYEVICRQSEEDAWRKARWDGWSASIMPQLMASFYPGDYPDKYASPAAEIIRRHAFREDSVQDNPYMECGRRFERPVLDWAQDIEGSEMYSWGELLRSKSNPILLATPDGWLLRDNSSPRKVLVEVKTHAPPPRKGVPHSVWGKGVPPKVNVQVQQQLYVTGLHEAVVVEWSYPGPPILHEVNRDEETIARIIDVATKTWILVMSIRDKEGLHR